MIRRAAIIIFALTASPALAGAQEMMFTVSAASADVHKGPSMANPVIGHAPRGAVLPVTRNLGSWVKVAWPDAEDGAGYVHVSTGRVATRLATARPASTTRADAPAPAATPSVPPAVRNPEPAAVARRTPVTITPASHVFGLGGLVGSTSRFGATARAWRSSGLGFQFGASRDALSSDAAPDRVTSMQLEPALVYALADDVGDYVWARAYVGSGASVIRQTLTLAAPGVPTSDTGFGVRVFGGAELTFASVPQFGLSADVGYRRVPTPFPGFDPKPWSVTIAGHWYVK